MNFASMPLSAIKNAFVFSQVDEAIHRQNGIKLYSTEGYNFYAMESVYHNGKISMLLPRPEIVDGSFDANFFGGFLFVKHIDIENSATDDMMMLGFSIYYDDPNWKIRMCSREVGSSSSSFAYSSYSSAVNLTNKRSIICQIQQRLEKNTNLVNVLTTNLSLYHNKAWLGTVTLDNEENYCRGLQAVHPIIGTKSTGTTSYMLIDEINISTSPLEVIDENYVPGGGSPWEVKPR